MIKQLHHVQFRVPKNKESESIRFYEDILGLERIPKSANLQENGGAWFKVGDNEFHVSLEDIASENRHSNRHLCFMVDDLDTFQKMLQSKGVEIIPDKQPIDEWIRFYLRDPGGNRVEIAQVK